MFGLDQAIAEMGGGGIAVALAVSLLLGLRHATDPDHLTAVSTLVMSEEERGPHEIDEGADAQAQAASSGPQKRSS